MRLIDTEKINLSGKFKKYDGKPLSADELKILYAVEMYLKIAVPTAYDVNKVVMEMKRNSFERYGNVGMGGQMVMDLDDAMEIVKVGGLNE